MTRKEYDDMPHQNRRLYDLVSDYASGNVSKFAAIIGITQQNINRVFRIDQRTGKYPTVSSTIKDSVKKNLGISEIYFLTDENGYESQRNNNGGSPYFETATIEGGKGTGFGNESLTIDNASGYMNMPGLPVGDDIPYIQVHGNSMFNRKDPSHSIPYGAWVGLKPYNSAAIQWGEVYAFMTCNGPIIKKLQPSDKDGCVKCVSFNEEDGYLPFDLPTSEIIGQLFRIVGVVGPIQRW